MAALLVAVPASASVIVLKFEGIGNLTPAGELYNGGVVANYGIELRPATLEAPDGDADCTGNVANEPSTDPLIFFLDTDDAVLNVPWFDTGSSSFDTSASVNVYDGLDATGNGLGTLSLAELDNCTGDPNEALCNWSTVGVAFGGISTSIEFGGATNRTAVDDTAFGGAEPVEASGAGLAAILELLGEGVGVAGLLFGLVVLMLRSRSESHPRSGHYLSVRRKEMAPGHSRRSGRIVVKRVR